jgi:hypothetical protein
MDATRTLGAPPIRNFDTDEELCAYFIDWKRLIRKLHTDRRVKIPLDQGEKKRVKIRTGIRQEFCLAPMLLDLYSENVTNETLEGSAHFKIRGHVILTVK